VTPPASNPATQTGTDAGGADEQTATATTTTVPLAPIKAADVVIPVIRPTTLRKPPPAPAPPPHQYGAVRQVQTDEIKNGLQVRFYFSSRPPAGLEVQTIWYYNNKSLGQALKNGHSPVISSVRSSSKLPAGYWRCTLRIKLPSGQWRQLQEALVHLP
jgi:hypothetical protein